jgi:hypothetical protein
VTLTAASTNKWIALGRVRRGFIDGVVMDVCATVWGRDGPRCDAVQLEKAGGESPVYKAVLHHLPWSPMADAA